MVFSAQDGYQVSISLHFKFKASNNEVEYKVVINGLKLAKSCNIKKIIVYSDSQLMVNQITNEFHVRGESMMQYATTTKALVEAFEHVEFRQIPREENTRSSSAEGTMEQPIIDIEMPNIYMVDIQMIGKKESWMNPIVQFLKNEILPANNTEEKNLKYRASRYISKATHYTREDSPHHS